MHGRITSDIAARDTSANFVDRLKRDKPGMTAKVVALEYDPNRSSRIALLQYLDGDKRYILAPDGLQVGDQVLSGPGADVKPGHAMKLKDIPLGSDDSHILKFRPGKGGQMVRSAGAVGSN